MTVMAQAPRRARKHSQLPPHYDCLACRSGDHNDCLDNLIPGKTIKTRMCHCDHTSTPKGPPPIAAIESPPPTTTTYRRPDRWGLRENEIVGVRGKAKPRTIEGS